MKQIQPILFQVKPSKANSERALIISDFLEKINSERKGTKYKQLEPKAVAIKVSHIPTNELRDFYAQCLRSKSGFSKCFFGALKPR